MLLEDRKEQVAQIDDADTVMCSPQQDPHTTDPFEEEAITATEELPRTTDKAPQATALPLLSTPLPTPDEHATDQPLSDQKGKAVVVTRVSVPDKKAALAGHQS